MQGNSRLIFSFYLASLFFAGQSVAKNCKVCCNGPVIAGNMLSVLQSAPRGAWIEMRNNVAISEDARKYCPNPKNPTEGLRLKSNGVWEKGEMIQGKRKSFSSKDPVEVWKSARSIWQ